jgi:hypothetical protein
MIFSKRAISTEKQLRPSGWRRRVFAAPMCSNYASVAAPARATRIKPAVFPGIIRLGTNCEIERAPGQRVASEVGLHPKLV